jgi:RHS repeat-associated protein
LNGNLANDGINTYTWDARNHLASLAGLTTAAFTYDPLGRRQGKTIGSAGTNFLYDSMNPVQELSGTNETANLLTGLGVDEYLTRTDALGTWNFMADGLGSTLALADSTGAVQTQYTYDPFGNTTVQGTSSANSYQFTGRENDGTGLYYYRARYYDQAISRFVSEDPIRMQDNPNVYAYVHDRPTILRDPFGLYALTGFTSPAFEAIMRLAIENALNKLRNSCCAGPEGNKLADKIDRSTFDFQPNLNQCGNTPKGSMVASFFGRPTTIDIGPLTFLPTLCGSPEIQLSMRALIYSDIQSRRQRRSAITVLVLIQR